MIEHPINKVEIISYKSIKDKFTLVLDPHITVLVGANDHGKSNVLSALTHFNVESPPPADEHFYGKTAKELSKEDFPEIVYTAMISEKIAKTAIDKVLADDFVVEDSKLEDLSSLRKNLQTNKNAVREVGVSDCQCVSRPKYKSPVQRLGFLKKLGKGSNILEGVVFSELYKVLPEVILFTEPPQLPYKVTASELLDKSNEVLQGMLKLSGCADRAQVMAEDSAAGRRAQRRFEQEFNDAFRAIYTQHSGLEWSLKLTDAGTNLVLEVTDETTELSNPQTKSLGFRSFLAYTLALYSVTGTEKPYGYLIAIDEPDIHLHPRGQKDMLRYFERLSEGNQVIFATHSPFMVPRRFPHRVRRIFRNEDGTRIDAAPYRESWATVISDLGVAAPDLFRYSDTVLLMEGSSDNVLLSVLVGYAERVANEHIDLDSFSFRSSEGASNMAFVAAAIDDGLTNIVVILDGDSAGKRAFDAIKRLKRSKIKSWLLDQLVGNSACVAVEDLLPIAWIRSAFLELLKDAVGLRLTSQEKVDPVLPKVDRMTREPNIKTVLARLYVEAGVVTDDREFPTRLFAEEVGKLWQKSIDNVEKGERELVLRFVGLLKECLGQ